LGIIQPVTRCIGRGLRKRTVCKADEEKEEREKIVTTILTFEANVEILKNSIQNALS